MISLVNHAAAFVALAAARATFVLLAACAADVALRRRGSAAARHLVWTMAAVGLLLLPALAPLVPAWAVVALPAYGDAATTGDAVDRAAAPAPSTVAADAPARVQGASDAPPAAGVAVHASASADPKPASFATLALGLYLCGVILLLTRIARQRRALRRLARGAETVTEREWIDSVARISRQLGITRRVTLLSGAACGSPMTWGTLRPAILVPADAADWPAERREAVLLHELAHVARLDCLTQTLAAAACIAYWFHPGAWWAARRLRTERELACDDRVLAAGTGARDYARELLEMARTLSPGPSPALAVSMAAARGQLETRVRAALDPRRVRTVPGWGTRIAAGALAAGLLSAVSAARVGAAAPAADLSSPIHADVVSRDAAPAAQEGATGSWQIERARDGADDVQISLASDGSMMGMTVPRARFTGLPAGAPAAAYASARFQVRGEAGTIDFTGAFSGGEGSGRYRFTPAPGFASAWSRRGLSAPTVYDEFRLVISGGTIAGVDAYLRELQVRPSTDDLVRFFTHAITTQYLRDLAAVGYGRIEPEEIIRLSNHGIDAATVRELRALGYARIEPEEVIRLRNHAIDTRFIREVQAAGYPLPDPEELIYLRNHDISVDEIRRENAAAGAKLDLTEIAHRRRHARQD